MSNISVDFDVLNQRGSPAWFTDTFANIPTAGFVGRMFISKDTFAFYRDTGSGWDLIGGPGIGTLTGSGVVGQVSFFNGTQVITGNNNLFWDNTNSRLGINTATPGQALDIHSTANTLIQLNNTTTGDSIISFQNQSVTKWKIGNLYNAGANSFDITNPILATTPFSISSAGAITLASNVTTTGAQLVQNGLYLTNANAGALALYTTIYARNEGINFGLRNGTGGASFIFQSANSYDYTFPATTGTLALLQSAQTFSALNSFNLSISAVGGVAFPSTNGGSNYGGILGTANFFQISAQNGSSILMLSSNGTSAITINTTGNVNFGSTIGNGTYTYTLPSATGTLALTSDLSSYLPLAGGTLTGGLVINPTNTAIVGLDVASNTTRFRSDNLEGFKRQLEIVMGSGTLVQLTAKGYLANYGTDMAFYTATTSGVNASPAIYITGTNNRVGIKTGTPSYDLDVSGTGNFSGALRIDHSTAGAYGAVIYNTSATGQGLTVRGGSTSSQDAFNVQTYDGNKSLLSVQGGGNVGIGISPISKFTINTGTNNNFNFYDNGSGVGINAVNDANSVYRMFNINANVLRLQGDVSGNVTIGTNTDYGYKLSLQGQPGANGYTLWTNYSDYRLKENIIDFEAINILDKIDKIRPVTYNYNKLTGYDEETRNRRTSGFIAQELLEVFPDMVGTKIIKDIEYYDTNLSNLDLYLVKAIQELNLKLKRNNIN